MYQVTYPATAEQVALGIAFEGEVKGVGFTTKEDADRFAAVTAGAEVDEDWPPL